VGVDFVRISRTGLLKSFCPDLFSGSLDAIGGINLRFAANIRNQLRNIVVLTRKTFYLKLN
jgi:hypothetical protein